MTDLPGILLLSIRIILVLLLYTFLFLSIRVLWLNLKDRPDRPIISASIPPLKFSRTEIKTPMNYLLEAPEATIGRAPDNTYQIADETVSGHHARFYFEAGQWWVQDLGSSNGTILNDDLLNGNSILTKDDRIQIGKVILKIVSTNRQIAYNPPLEGVDQHEKN